MRTQPILTQPALFGLLLLGMALCAVPAGAVPVGDSAPSTLRIEIDGADEVLSHYTIGLYNLATMTASNNDPDFQIQALQADRVILLQEFGSPANSTIEIELPDDGEYGLFLMRDATLRDFSLGKNPYRPIFSTPGAPGSHLLQQIAVDGMTSYLFQTYLSVGVAGGVVAPAGNGAYDAPGGGLSISIFNPNNLDNDNIPIPVVPEPATLALIGVGLACGGALRRRRV
jgi:hypothetical protein